eukprot:NODE_8295_length_710_cov_196.245315_g8041_i0.p2 GENE.NODE_8295_length_710_cov_196.245315_g8041_i0~~NODE_8295_length_710_cov_196.245315_g8041_i0.p2  ORF type:complete len:175 (-),score=35.84 NODE_8295_length_710_cov_196.245315_g8041_i0:128-652(-)
MHNSVALLMRRTASKMAKEVIQYSRPNPVQGFPRIMMDQPSRWIPHKEKLYKLTDHERELADHDPFIGVDHLYEAHQGAKEKPIVVQQMGIHGSDIMVGCLGMCSPDTVDNTTYGFVPQNALVVCGDCGLHFVARNNEEVTFWPDGTQPHESVQFSEVEAMLTKHLRYGSPILL